MGETIVITSGKGGVGKTTITANLGISLSQLGFSVVMVDADIGLRNLDLVMGIEKKVKYHILDVSKGLCTLEDALVKDTRSKTPLCLLPASQSHFKEDIQKDDFSNLIQSLQERFQYVLIDSPAGIEYGFRLSMKDANQGIVVVNPEVSSIRDADRVISILEQKKIKPIYLIINRVNSELLKKKEIITPEEIQEILDVPLLGVIPEDPAVVISANQGKPFAYQTQSKLGELFLHIAKQLSSEEPIVIEDSIKAESLWNKVKKSFTLKK